MISPLETPKGWLILTQATGAMGKRALCAALISHQNPSKILARATIPVFQVYDLNHAGIPGKGITLFGGFTAQPIGYDSLQPVEPYVQCGEFCDD